MQKLFDDLETSNEELYSGDEFILSIENVVDVEDIFYEETIYRI